jgi:hypothetical protein
MSETWPVGKESWCSKELGEQNVSAKPYSFLTEAEAGAMLSGATEPEDSIDNNPRFHGWLRVHELKLSRGAKHDKHPSYRAARVGRWK